MALVTDPPKDLPEANPDVLQDLVDPDAPPPPPEKVEIYLSGAHVATLDGPLDIGTRVLLMVEIEVIEAGTRSLDGGDTSVEIRRARRVGDMWQPGTPRPMPKKTKAEEDAEAEAAAAENQPPLYDETGGPYDPDAAETEVETDDTGHPVEDPEDDDLGRPPFSDGGK